MNQRDCGNIESDDVVAVVGNMKLGKTAGFNEVGPTFI